MVFEPASTLLMKKFTPSVWMSRIMITWVSSKLLLNTGEDGANRKVVIGHRLHVSGDHSELYRDAGMPVLLGFCGGWLLSWSFV
jgi:hypothetical protein